SSEISRGHAHVGDGRLPFWFRSRASPSFFAIAMDAAFVKQLWEMEFDRADDFELNTAIGVRDPVIKPHWIARSGRTERRRNQWSIVWRKPQRCAGSTSSPAVRHLFETTRNSQRRPSIGTFDAHHRTHQRASAGRA